MRRVRCSSFLCLTLLLLCSPAGASQHSRNQDQYQNPDQDQDQDLELELQHHRLLQRARSAGLLSQEWNKRAVEDLLSQFTHTEDDVQQDAEVASMATGGRMELERSVDAPNNLPPRERKAGCKNFYWKGFTSC
ncbi:somatostatin-2-like [Thalassophryne amazonica]|uniref:somatostatin-2-like n=1 Tax=Thalassophryne amazonica TaxID=390379 RepID=UPI00147138FD|nr:somatostatin-2-like [Thalassophryne amazonica]